MDLIPQVECRRCGTEYSSLQSRCPKCGARKMKQTQRAPGTTSGTVAGTYANEQAQVNTRWQMTFAAILVVAVILAMIVLISTSLNTTPGGADSQQGGDGAQIQVGDTSPTPTPTVTPSPTPTPEITGLELYYAGQKITEFTEAIDRETPLTLSYYPMNIPVTASDIKWSSDNESVAVVEGDQKGCVITNKGVGKAIITVELYGKSASVTVYGRESW